jgi:hypothetical protein
MAFDSSLGSSNDRVSESVQASALLVGARYSEPLVCDTTGASSLKMIEKVISLAGSILDA